MPLFSSLSLYSSICINLKTGYVTTTLTQHKEVCDQRREKGNEREKGIERDFRSLLLKRTRRYCRG